MKENKIMKFKEFVKNLNELIEGRPETAEFDVVTSIDNEGNGFNLVHYTPTVGHYNSKDRDFESEKELNAVCIN